MKEPQRNVTNISSSKRTILLPELLKQAELAQGEDIDAEFTGILTEVIKEHDHAFKGLVDR
ncbi:hypothetical protein [Bacillus dakarensis]|uniref:hypothetical protein n=1 Tax=Robertmurraya dakarensis TaxID=1926278 RepID=UPI000980DF93|nr:hypothetical protein [Bacillus dakarensis]